MNKVRWIWIRLLAAGAVAVLAFLGGCSRQGSAAGGHRGGRYAVEAARAEHRNGLAERSRGGQGRVSRNAAQGLQGQGRPEAAQYRSAALRGEGRSAGRRDGAPAAAKAAGELNGRSVVEPGRLAEFTGRLDSERSEWCLITEDARRTEEGVPLWAGRGRQAATGRGGGAGRQNGSSPLLEG